jgi:hypothetical protein
MFAAKKPQSKLHDKDAREAALAFAGEQKRRDWARQKEKAARKKGARDASKPLQRRKQRLNRPCGKQKAPPKRSHTRGTPETVTGGGRALGEAKGET